MKTKCIEFEGSKTKHGYGQKWYRGKNWPAHRLAYQDAYGEIPKGLLVRHMCHNRSCVNPDHLKIGTIQDNMRDRQEAGRQAKGEQAGQAKLTEAQVREIYNLKGKISGHKLGKQFDVTGQAVYKIWRGLSWRHIPR